MTRRRVATLGAALLALLTLTGCSSAKPSPTAAGCSWPATTAPGASGIALGLSLGDDQLLAWDAASGRLVGDCPTTEAPLPAPAVPFTADGTQVSSRGLQYLLPPVAGATVTAMPDNTAAASAGSDPDQGGVRELATGEHRPISFGGWLVVSVIADRLLLVRATSARPVPTEPGDWCVLPALRAPRSACGAVPGSSGPGTPSVSAAGTIGWTPLAGEPLRIGPVAGWAARSAAAGISGWSTADGRGSIVSPDQRTVVFPAGVDGRGRLAWASVAAGAQGGLQASVHQSAFANTGAYHLPDATGLAGAFGAGAGLVLADQRGVVSRFDAGPDRRPVVTLHLPKRASLGYLLTWPASIT